MTFGHLKQKPFLHTVPRVSLSAVSNSYRALDAERPPTCASSFIFSFVGCLFAVLENTSDNGSSRTEQCGRTAIGCPRAQGRNAAEILSACYARAGIRHSELLDSPIRIVVSCPSIRRLHQCHLGPGHGRHMQFMLGRITCRVSFCIPDCWWPVSHCLNKPQQRLTIQIPLGGRHLLEAICPSSLLDHWMDQCIRMDSPGRFWGASWFSAHRWRDFDVYA